MEIIILAGGLGTRLSPVIGNEIPKCMAPILGKPFLWYLLKYLTQYPVTKVILSVGHLHKVIIQWINKVKNEFPFTFDYAIEKTPLGTGGGIKLALDRCTYINAIILNGDTFFNVDLIKLNNEHSFSHSTISLALKPMKNFNRYGRVMVNDDIHIITGFCEKTPCAEGKINGGIYIIDRTAPIFKGLANKFSFETEVLVPQTQQCHVFGFEHDDYFIDIGIPSDYAKANEDFKTLF